MGGPGTAKPDMFWKGQDVVKLLAVNVTCRNHESLIVLCVFIRAHDFFFFLKMNGKDNQIKFWLSLLSASIN